MSSYYPYGAPQYAGGASQPQGGYQYPGYYQQQPQQQYVQQQPAMAQYGSVPFPAGYASPPVQPAPISIQPSRSTRSQTPHPGPQRRHTTTSHGHTTAMNAGAAAMRPLRSALKSRPERAKTSITAVPLNRTRTTSGGESRIRNNSISRTRTNSSARADPVHIFLAIEPPATLDVSNIASPVTIQELKDAIISMWHPGITYEHTSPSGTHWHARLGENPWNMWHPYREKVQQMVCKIFWVMGNLGYTYLSSINTGHSFKSPRLVFVRDTADPGAHFFSMTLDRKNTVVTFVDPPASLSQSLRLQLNTTFRGSIAEDDLSDANVYRLWLNKSLDSPEMDKDLFLAHILKNINEMAFKLDASVPMARRGLFGLGGRQEMWIFKGSPHWWTSTTRRPSRERRS